MEGSVSPELRDMMDRCGSILMVNRGNLAVYSCPKSPIVGDIPSLGNLRPKVSPAYYLPLINGHLKGGWYEE